MKKTVLSLTAAAALLAAASAAWATMVIPSSLEQMAGLSDAILVGLVRDQYSYWEDRKIFTSVIVDVTEFIKAPGGETPAALEVKFPGGKVGEIKLEVDQAPQFTTGEEVLLFLNRSGGVFRPYGFYYGVYKIRLDAGTGRKIVYGPLFNQPLVYDLKTMKADRNTVPSGGEDLSSFTNRLRKLVR
ncbi:MAG: hypothetical protein AB1641_25505 [Thermodesulfobacteriota bacterium]